MMANETGPEQGGARRLEQVLVLGAGELGLAVLRGLAPHAAERPGASVTVLLRPATPATDDLTKPRDLDELRALGVDVVEGDLAAGTVSDLAALLRPFGTVVCCTGFVGGPGTQARITAAVLEAGVRRYVPWQFGVDYDAVGRGSPQGLWDEQLDVRDMLRGQDRTSWVIVSTGMFTSFLFEPSFGVADLDGGVVCALGGWDTAVTVTTPEDIGALTAAILFAEPPVADQVVRVAGDTITYGRLADVVGAALGRPVRREVRTIDDLRADLARDPGDDLAKYRLAFAEGRGTAWDKSRTFNAERGIPVTDVPSWLRRIVQ